jgi:uncharacterized iron-regulated membrane protein
MRTLHRWTGLTLGLVLLFVGVTGILIQGFALYGDLGENKNPVVAAKAVTNPECKRVDPPRSPAKQWEVWFKHLHSGETFGPVGAVISILSGFALMFFAVSGLWMYWQMWRRRVAGNRREIFWRR